MFQSLYFCTGNRFIHSIGIFARHQFQETLPSQNNLHRPGQLQSAEIAGIEKCGNRFITDVYNNLGNFTVNSGRRKFEAGDTFAGSITRDATCPCSS
ncbi:MAG: hypothetical protein K9I59_10290 [Chlorobium sp.]|uniref:hypothetical protein n=1 Tax=Chlorobium sp. TaxID=1095 RepID=UPI0025C5992B|nr:hypothetical protein [Chlorobium sp.]MCF8217204.1 hypothetical protein [Chlorobium sp.]MCF8272063.1 hypothetical protein [Chlorobium sp.]MCF8288422.1 hypothetical protein [Chlorobium sp.]MCF8292013.1 hypothetical protein [Chlorobium sp.]MCF8386114.1 hypothetical protein [Chlorobium sp.]